MTPDEFNKAILEEIDKITIDKEVWQLGIELLKAKHKEEISRHTVHLKAIQDRYKSIRDKMNRLIDMRADGEITKEEFKTGRSFNWKK